MKGNLPDDRRWFLRRSRLPGARALWGAAILLAFVIAFGMWPRSHAPTKNSYFRVGDPTPLAFSILRTGMNFDELQHDPHGGQGFEIGYEWRPKSGPFDDVKAEFASGLVSAQYHLRPQYFEDFRSGLDAAFADYERELGPEGGN